MTRRQLFFVLLLTGCMFPTGGTGTNTRLLSLNEHTWKAAKVADYDFEFKEGCFCDPSSPAFLGERIEVRNGKVSRVLSLQTDQPITAPGAPTIDSLFAQSWRRIGYGYALTFDFDLQLGYPRKISGDVPGALDAGFTIDVSNFVRR